MKESEFWSSLKLGTQRFVESNYKSLHLYWTRIENIGGSGVPDAYGFIGRRHAWVELKVAHGNKVHFQPSQIAWLTDHALDNAFILVKKDDTIRVFPGHAVHFVHSEGWNSPCMVLELRKIGGRYDWQKLMLQLFGI